MNGYHWITIVVVFVVALFVQQRLNVLGMVGL